MSQAEKAALWGELKSRGVEFPLHYREYSQAQLEEVLDNLNAEQGVPTAAPPLERGMAEPEPAPAPQRVAFTLPRREPDRHAGLRINTHAEDEPLRVDENGLVWYQDEVRKAAFPKPRGRRVLDYMDPGVKTVTAQTGNGYTETFEMPGDQAKPSQVKITLPSHQVGIYKDPNMPFKIHVYQDNRGFDLFEVRDFYGGADLVPEDIKTVYVAQSLCYDIRTTRRAIEAEYREKLLKKEISE
jgi:hypothetical protein